MSSPPPPLAARFRADLLALAPEFAETDRLALAVSGGPDSMAMLALGAAALPGRVLAATVDHRLRPESAEEAAMVARVCADLGVPHATLPIEVPPGASGNLPSWARHMRYALLRRWAYEQHAPFLSTAHHAEDQAETFLMRAARGAGIAGLAGIRARQEAAFFASVQPLATPERDGVGCNMKNASILLLRPLLGWRRAELREVVSEAKLSFVDDPSNADTRFDRTRFREWLRTAPWLNPTQVARSARNLAEIDADFQALGLWLWRERARIMGGEVTIDVAGLPREVRRRLARMAVALIESLERGPREIEEFVATENVEHLLEALEAGKGATQGEAQASARGTIWHFRKAPPRRAI